MSAIRNSFKAYERLKREQHIDTLFRKGKAFSVFPLKMIVLDVARAEGELSPVRAGFSVPKKKFRKAVERNRVKRLMREAWRLEKQRVYETITSDRQLHIFILFTAPELPHFAEIATAMQKAVLRLVQKPAP